MANLTTLAMVGLADAELIVSTAMVGLVDAELIFNDDGRACRCRANVQWRWSGLPMRS